MRYFDDRKSKQTLAEGSALQFKRWGTCPDCGSEVEAEWKKDTVCLQPWCETCQRFLLEDEVDWAN